MSDFVDQYPLPGHVIISQLGPEFFVPVTTFKSGMPSHVDMYIAKMPNKDLSDRALGIFCDTGTQIGPHNRGEFYIFDVDFVNEGGKNIPFVFPLSNSEFLGLPHDIWYALPRAEFSPACYIGPLPYDAVCSVVAWYLELEPDKRFMFHALAKIADASPTRKMPDVGGVRLRKPGNDNDPQP